MASRSRKATSSPSTESTSAAREAFEKAIKREAPEVQELRRAERRLKGLRVTLRQEKAYRKELEKQLDVAERRIDHALAIEAHQATKRSFTPRRFSSQEAVAHLVASDWHIGERVDPKRVNYSNRYDDEIAVMSMHEFFDKAAQFIKWRRKGSLTIRTGVLGLLGDLMTGHLHEDQKRTNTLNPFEETAMLMDVLEERIPRLIHEAKLEKLWVPCCRGNHGRNYDGKKRYALAAEDSFEQFLYGRLAHRFKGDKKIEFVLSEGEFTHGKLFDRRIRYMHGDQFRFAGGVGGIAPSMFRFVNRLDSNDPEGRADHNFMGHWHQWMTLGHITVNGSLIGTTTYGAGLGMFDRPKQDFSLWNADDGLIDCAPICIQRKI